MPSLLFVTSFCLATSSTAVAYFYFLHRSLEHRVVHGSQHGKLPSSLSATITSIPPEVFTDEYYAIHDHASRRVSRKLLPNKETDEVFTMLLRRNMTAFGKFPQAWIIRLIVPPVDRKTFSAAHIHSLNFEKGDLVCGVYRVEERTPDKAVLAILINGPIGGRLVLRYTEDGEEIVYHSETAMWTKREPGPNGTKRAIMPLEKPVLRFLHEMAAWWLLDSGVRFLTDGKEGSPLQYTLISHELWCLTAFQFAHCEERTRQKRLPDEHPTLCLQCEEAWLAAHSGADHRHRTCRRSLPPKAMEPDGSYWFVPARASPLESEMDAVLRAASPSTVRAESLSEEMIRHHAKAFAKLFGEVGSDDGDQLFNTLPDDVHKDPSPQGNVAVTSSDLDLISFEDAELVDMPASEESSISDQFVDCRQVSLLDTEPCEPVLHSEDCYPCSSQDADGDAEMDLDATMDDQHPYRSASSKSDSFFDAQSASSQQQGSTERTSLQSPLSEGIKMSRFDAGDIIDCDNMQVAISIAEDRMAILEAQIWEMEVLLNRKIAEHGREGNTSIFSFLATGIAGTIIKLLSVFGLSRTEAGQGTDNTGTHRSPDPDGDWEVMDADEIQQEMWRAQAKLEALETQVTNMQNAFSRKMLVLLVERLIVAHRMLDRRLY
ncbi:hypothetical protein BJX96DRAFT_162169 [Aspergillus floccosus]